MLDLKKTLMAFLSISSNTLFAGTMGFMCSVGNVTVPCEDAYGSFSVQALYLQPVYDADFVYDQGFVYPSFQGTITDTFTNNEFNQNKPQAGWGFRLEGSYHFDEGKDLSLNWSHFSRKTNHVFLGGFYRQPFLLLPVLGTISIEPQWNAINFELGQHVDFGDFKDIRFYAGFGGVQIKRNARATLEDTELVEDTALLPNIVIQPIEHVTFAATDNTIDFKGFGPRIGTDMAYNFDNGFALFGNAAAALFIGQSSFQNNFGVIFENRYWPTRAVALHGKKFAVVPSLEAKIGVSYTYEMAQGDLTIDLGYMAVNYFNALQSARLDVFSNPLIAESDFGLSGAFIGIKWVGLA